jgi:hypothetical protein
MAARGHHPSHHENTPCTFRFQLFDEQKARQRQFNFAPESSSILMAVTLIIAPSSGAQNNPDKKGPAELAPPLRI